MEYDILSIKENISSIKAEAGKVNSLKKANIERLGVRRFENGKMFQTSRLGNASADRLIADAKEYGGQGIDYSLPFAPAYKESRESSTAYESIQDSFKEGLNYLNKNFPAFAFGGQCNVFNKNISLNSSYGLDLHSAGGLCDWYFIYQKKGSGNMMDGFFSETSQNPNIIKTIHEQIDFIKAQSKIQKIQSGRIPVLLVECMEPLKKLLDSFHINKYKDGAALYSGKIGEKLFSPKVSITDCNYDPAIGALNFFDGEGIVRKNDLILIDQGKFASHVSDIRFAKKYGSESTGNGLRPYNRGINLGFNSLRFKKLSTPWREIVKNLDQCLIALVTAGGDSNDLGEYSTPVQIGYIMQKGQIVGLAPQVTVKTTIENYLGGGLIDISSDGFTASSPSACVISEMDVLVN